MTLPRIIRLFRLGLDNFTYLKDKDKYYTGNENCAVRNLEDETSLSGLTDMSALQEPTVIIIYYYY